jgi:hypothetical protein
VKLHPKVKVKMDNGWVKFHPKVKVKMDKGWVFRPIALPPTVALLFTFISNFKGIRHFIGKRKVFGIIIFSKYEIVF